MNELSPLSRPFQSQVTIDPTVKECPSEGFNYPTFRLLNKQARVYLSTPLNPPLSTPYYLFSITNSRGWFAAVKSASSGSEIVLSPLEDLRSAFTTAKADNETPFNAKRSLSIPTKANIIRFACADSRFLVGLEDGSIVVYDTSAILTPGTNDIQPLNRIQIQSSPLRQIVPNPGSEPGLNDLVAVVGDGNVHLLNKGLESQGGWVASDLMSQPIAVDWSPKGKHIAIGLQTGDILTFSPANKATFHKHVPPTLNSILISLNWLGPGHTFRTSYAAQGEIPATQHIVSFDTKSSTVTYFAPDHPFPLSDRTNQASYVANLPKWDVNNDSNEDNKSLTVVGDISSVDLEVLGSAGNQWYRQYQENPLSLPLDKSTEDTILLALEWDLTDSSSSQPIFSSTSTYGMAIESQGPVKDADMGASNLEATPARSVFGQTSFGQASQSPFGGQKTSVFGQTGFGAQTSSSAPHPLSVNPLDSLGKPILLQQQRPSYRHFLQASGAFSGLNSTSENIFGTGNFGAPNTKFSPSQSPVITREASMSDATPALDGMSLGGAHPTDSNVANSMFGSFSTPPATAQKDTTSFGGSLIKPATGFGAFGSFKSTGAFDVNKTSVSTTTSAFGAPSQPTAMPSGFGQSGFASPSFGKTSFGQPAFGQTSFGASATPSASTSAFGSSNTSSGFSAFVSATPVFGLASPDTPKSPQPATDVKRGRDMESPPGSPTKPFAPSPPSSPEPIFGKKKSISPPAPAPAAEGAFPNMQTTPSAFSRLLALEHLEALVLLLDRPQSLAARFLLLRGCQTGTSNGSNTGGFSAFGGTSVGFGAFAGQKTSFSDLLKTGGDEVKDPEQKLREGMPKVRTSAIGTFVKKEDERLATVTSSAEPKEEKRGKKWKSLKSKRERSRQSLNEKKEDHAVLEEEEEEEEVPYDDELEDDRDSFLSDNFSESSYKDGDSANEEERMCQRRRIHLSLQRTIACISFSDRNSSGSSCDRGVPSAEAEGGSTSEAAPAREPSTTPPSTPVKEAKSLFGPSPTLVTPSAPSPSSGPSGFGLGLGRPSTRPSRSSPLANAVVPAEEEEEEEVKSPVKSIKPAISPKPVFGTLPVVSEVKEGTPSPVPVPSTPVLAPTTPPSSTKPTGATSQSYSLGISAGGSTSTPNLFGKTAEKGNLTPPSNFSMPDLTRPTTAPPASGLTSLFGAAPQSSTFAPPVSTLPPFTLNNAKSPPVFGTASIFGAAKSPSLAPTAPQGLFGGKAISPPPLPAGGLFGHKAAPTTPNVFGAPSSATQAAAPFTPKARPSPEAILEEGMQKECANLIILLESEFTHLRKVAQVSSAKLSEARTPTASGHIAKLENADKWHLGDLHYFAQTLIRCQTDLEELSSHRETEAQMLRELQSNTLKAVTRKEEIARFNKAKNDKEFTRILRARSLGPENSEKQSSLRRSIRSIRDRVQKLEFGLLADKKKLAQAASRKPSMRPPTLDTINRTYRNIELTIDQQSEDVARLTSRIAKLKVTEESPSPPKSDKYQSPSIGRRRPYNVTPNVAITTAAALNAERSARRLKKALLSVRKEPILNRKAVSAPSAPLDFKTPQKVFDKALFATPFPMAEPLFGEPVTPKPLMTPSSIPLPEFNLPEFNNVPEDNFNPIGPSPLQERRGASSQRKRTSVPSAPLKRSTGSAVPLASPAVDFEWGPLPSFPSPVPTASLPKSFVSFSSVKK
ncbi:hypothetical protein CPB84DRAFT_1822580 [Gymnopilus junonius]|uniref:Nucleoporin Nup159/Nup146 N-terminal domain-containing protein n=1 Tax=Gymnopilus junonius TaxID=109634 RepID=A0A9P5NWA3_GYMJU|nr:hypothetical protein CPB84DRAFT_1822580 [Gymnopilus junonius]